MINQIHAFPTQYRGSSPQFGMAYRAEEIEPTIEEGDLIIFEDPDLMNLFTKFRLGVKKLYGKIMGIDFVMARSGEDGFGFGNQAVFFSNTPTEMTYNAFLINVLKATYPSKNILGSKVDFSNLDELYELENELYTEGDTPDNVFESVLAKIAENPSHLNRFARALANEGKNIDLSSHTFYD